MKALKIILLGIFIGVNSSIANIERKSSAQSTNEFPTAKLRQALKTAKANLEKTQSGIKTRYEKDPTSRQSIVSGYLFNDVIKAIDKGKTDLIDSLAGEELAGYRAHVKKFYPKPKLEFVGFSIERPLVSVESSNETFRRIERYIEKIDASAASPVIDLMINSTPTTGYFEMWVEGESSTRSLTTNNPMKNISRGYYSYRLTKADHKEVKGTLNLIDEDGTELNCIMNKTDDREGPYPCSLR